MADANASTKAADRFWTFSVALYGRPGVAPACLSLQDRCGVDVNLLLFCCWAGAEGRDLSEPVLRSAMNAAAPWQDEVVRPLRAVRRRLKAGVDPLPGDEAEALRRQIAALELEAERIEQRTLAGVMPPPARGEPSAVAACANLTLYLGLCGLAVGPAEWADLAVILRAAFPEAPLADLSFAASG